MINEAQPDSESLRPGEATPVDHNARLEAALRPFTLVDESSRGALEHTVRALFLERRSEAAPPEALRLSTSAVRGLYSVAGIEPGDEVALMAELARRLGVVEPRSAEARPGLHYPTALDVLRLAVEAHLDIATSMDHDVADWCESVGPLTEALDEVRKGLGMPPHGEDGDEGCDCGAFEGGEHTRLCASVAATKQRRNEAPPEEHPAHSPEWALRRLREWAIGGSEPNEAGEEAIERDVDRVRDCLKSEAGAVLVARSAVEQQQELALARADRAEGAIARMVALVEGYQVLYAEACEVLEQQDDVPGDVLRRITRGESKLHDRINAQWPGDSGALPERRRERASQGDRAPAAGPPNAETCSHRWSGADGFRRCVDCGSETLNPKHGVEVARAQEMNLAQDSPAPNASPDPMRVACPWCDVLPGVPCMNASGPLGAGVFHEHRRLALLPGEPAPPVTDWHASYQAAVDRRDAAEALLARAHGMLEGTTRKLEHDIAAFLWPKASDSVRKAGGGA